MLENPQEWVFLKEDMPGEVVDICEAAYTLHTRVFDPSQHLIAKEPFAVYRIIQIRKDLQVLRNLSISFIRKTSPIEEVAEQKVDLGEKEQKTVIQKIEEDLKANERNILEREEKGVTTNEFYAFYLRNVHQYLSIIYTIISDLKPSLHEKLYYYPETIPLNRIQLGRKIHDIMQGISEYVHTCQENMREERVEYALDMYYSLRNNFTNFGQELMDEYAKVTAPILYKAIKQPPQKPKKKIEKEEESYHPVIKEMFEQEIDIYLLTREEEIWLQIIDFERYGKSAETLTRKLFGYSPDDLKIMTTTLAEVAIRYVGLLISLEKAKTLPRITRLPSGEKVEKKEMSDEEAEDFLDGKDLKLEDELQ